MKKLFGVLLVLALVLSFGLVATTPVGAATSVGGTIDADTTWSVAGSPYIVTEDVIVEDGVTLTIEAGVEVRFHDDTGLICDGVLLAVGSESSPIVFTTNREVPPDVFHEYRVWDGIHLRGEGASGSHLEYCTVEYGAAGTEHPNVPGWVHAGGSIYVGVLSPRTHVDDVVIRNCIIRKGNLSEGAASHPYTGIYFLGHRGTVTHNCITECIWGIFFISPNEKEEDRSFFSHNTIEVLGTYAGSPTVGAGIRYERSGYFDIDSNVMRETGSGITSASTGIGEGHINIRNNQISEGTGTGIGVDSRVPSIAIEGNVIDACPAFGSHVGSRAMDIGSTGDTVADNVTVIGNIVRNVSNGLRVWPEGCVIRCNSFENIEGIALSNRAGSPRGTAELAATLNWWGDASGPFHAEDNPEGQGGEVSDNVDFYPWLPADLGGALSVETATATGPASFIPSHGAVEELQALADLPPDPPEGVTFPHGMFEFRICCLTPGQTVTVTIELPEDVPVGYVWWKYQDGEWYWLPNETDDGDNIMTITLVDGGLGDADGVADGFITDPGGPGNPEPEPDPDPAPIAVGWEGSSVSKAAVVAPWIALLATIMASTMLLVVRRRRAQA